MEYKSCLIVPAHLLTSPEVSEHATLIRILEVNTPRLISAILPEIIYPNCWKKKRNPKKGKWTLRLVHIFLLCKDQGSYNECKESPLYQELKSTAVMQALAEMPQALHRRMYRDTASTWVMSCWSFYQLRIYSKCLKDIASTTKSNY